MTERFNILLVDDDPTIIAVLSRMLSELGQLRFATNGADALRLARQTTPDLILLDVEMPGMSGFDVCAAMKEDILLQDVPIIFVTSHDSEAQEVKGLTLGAVDFISKPPRKALVSARVRTHLRMKQMSDRLRHAATTDALTGIANRRQFDETLAREWPRALRMHAPLSLLLVDIDFFKDYNDHFGHQAGDDCLIAVATAMHQVARRPTDLLARYGGEEFALLLPETDAHGAGAVGCQLIQLVEALQIPQASSSLIDHLTISVGVSAYDETCVGWSDYSPDALLDMTRLHVGASQLVGAADQALYAAKHAGRRQVQILKLDDFGLPDRARALDCSNHAADFAKAPAPVAPNA